MKLLLSTSTSTFSKGDRVVVKIAKDEWYLATILSAGTKQIKLQFDDGGSATVEPTDYKRLKLIYGNLAHSGTKLSDTEARTKYKLPEFRTLNIKDLEPYVFNGQWKTRSAHSQEALEAFLYYYKITEKDPRLVKAAKAITRIILVPTYHKGEELSVQILKGEYILKVGAYFDKPMLESKLRSTLDHELGHIIYNSVVRSSKDKERFLKITLKVCSEQHYISPYLKQHYNSYLSKKGMFKYKQGLILANECFAECVRYRNTLETISPELNKEFKLLFNRY